MSGNTTRISWLLALVGGAGLLGAPVSSQQGQQSRQPSTTLGVLTCSPGGTDAGPAAQSRDVLCQFRPGRQASQETYAGTIRSVGQTQALYEKGTIMLAVRGPASTKIVPGLLQQAYAAEASLVSAAAPLIGEANSTLVLQPLMEEVGRVAAGKTRPDVTIIMVELKLKASLAWRSAADPGELPVSRIRGSHTIEASAFLRVSDSKRH